MVSEDKYVKLGVNASKKGIEVFRPLIKSICPSAFVDVIKDPETQDGLILHVDGAGSKPVLAYLCYKEFGGTHWFRGLSQDVIAMNIDDVVTVGAKPIAFADYISINAFRLPRFEVIRELSIGFSETLSLISEKSSDGVKLLFAGGETADLPDQVRTLDVSGAVFAKVKLSQVIHGQAISKGDIIVGLRSGGKTKYEKRENSGLMCNGLTLARHVLLRGDYELKYPEVCEPLSAERYSGRFKVDDYLDEVGMTLSEALLSPTRIYFPVVHDIVKRLKDGIKGMVHNTGGGLTKILRIGRGVRYVKYDLPDPDPIFLIIQREGKVSWDEMYRVFNMGVGFEVIVQENYVDDVISRAEKYGLEAHVIGRVEEGELSLNELIIKTKHGTFIYRRQLKSAYA